MNIYIFSYGSLRNAKSRALTLPGKRETVETVLRGYVRTFNAPVDGYLYLNISPKEGGFVPGTLIRVSGDELERTKLREPGYDCVEVSSYVVDRPEGFVFAFIAPERSYPGMKIPQSYIDTCLAAVPAAERETWLADSVVENTIKDDSADPVYENAA